MTVSRKSQKKPSKKLKAIVLTQAEIIAAADPDILVAWLNGLRPSPQMTVSEWAEQYRTLGSKTSAEPGRWRNSRTPYMIEVMDCLSVYHPATEVWLMKGSQIAGTEVGNNWIGYSIHHAPAPTLIIYPRVDDSKNTSKIRLDAMLEDTPALAELIPPARSRDSRNTTLVKEFPGGVLKLVGANAAAGLKSMAAQNIFGDEVDEFPADVQGQGDPIDLALVRSRTFGAKRKAFFVSSPTIKGISRIDKGYEKTDQRRYFVPCPHCGHMQILQWGNIRWDRDDQGNPIFESIHYLCETINEDDGVIDGCGGKIFNHHKTQMLANGKWRATATGEPGKVGFKISSLYSPVGWYSWTDAAADFWSAKKSKDREKMKVFVNTVMGECTEDEGSAADPDTLQSRADQYAVQTVPSDGLLLTAGIDTQDDRLALLVVAWGRGEECWIVHWDQFYGDPARPEVWAKLDEAINNGFAHTTGAELHIASASIDSAGHKTQDVYNYCRTRGPRVVAIKGSSTAKKPIINKPTPQDVTYQGKNIPSGVMLWEVGVSLAKKQIISRLNLESPGPGFIHTPLGLDDEFYRQITAEKLVTTWKKGIPKEEWKKIRARNEALDCLVYAYHAALRSGLSRIKNWDELAASVANRIGSKSAPVAARRKTVKSSFMG